MCGIFGIVSRFAVERETVVSCTKALRHRGPDAEGIYLHPSGKISLGHTRLSIIDLSPEANQPMQSVDGRYVVAFNGEIYNFRDVLEKLKVLRPELTAQTKSDTEVILMAYRQWGVEMVHQFEGMFAIALLDVQTQQLYLFRDRLGKKPLYYFWSQDFFIFGSELKSLLKHPAISACREIDCESITDFLHLGFIPSHRTIYRSIRKLPPGTYAHLESLNSFAVFPYWSAPAQVRTIADHRVSDGEYQTEFTNLLERSIRNRLISDVPVGCFLSGGTDSSLVTALASRLNEKDTKTFSIGFKESKFNEQPFAERVAKVLGTNHVSYVLSESEAAQLVETYLAHIDEPFADTSMIPTMIISQLARKDVTVALTGDGGDELFLGYGAYRWAKRLSNPILRLGAPLISAILQRSGRSRYQRIAHLFEQAPEDQRLSHIFSQEQYFFSDRELRSQVLADTLHYQPFSYRLPPLARTMSSEERQALFDLQFYLPDDLLVKVDRASMLYGLECRCPLLDFNVVEFAINAPLNVKRRKGVDKWLMKRVLEKFLPSELVHRPKWGFSIPLAQWLKTQLNYLVKENLTRDIIEHYDIVNYEYVKGILDRFYQGSDYLFNRIWTLTVLHKWLRDNHHG